ncbi:hypothetical protein LTR56_003036 [Elasticomyces elasticus]|nr:hypothetical protein LTR56_003036 [Elasticomyces elasticus]KAK3662099.1 hypothetical protein LTR22_007071 [Elasticomyces elasticus]KAK4927538.1 hypothetical protein LTR49_005679 [Elasticomyces elasticus]KAK5743688.1 hypothetical protein LTS12_023768 [Elasticomyces elasticus]
MPSEAQPPLTWQGSATPHPILTDQLPEEVITCLQNARFLHLATCTHNRPHVSLMNYTYLPSHTPSQNHPNLPPGPLIIMTSNPSSRKTLNLLENPNVSLLVHDWVSSRPPHVAATAGERERSPVGGRSSSLATMLMQLNSAAVSSISATINGETSVLELGSEEERWCREQHLANNTFDTSNDGASGGQALFGRQDGGEDGGRGSYIEDQDVRVVVVRIRDGRISDWKGGVKNFCLRDNGARTAAAQEDRGRNEGGEVMTNGVGGRHG